MGLEKHRKKQVFKDGITVAGSANFAQQVDFAGLANFTGSLTATVPFSLKAINASGLATFTGCVAGSAPVSLTGAVNLAGLTVVGSFVATAQASVGQLNVSGRLTVNSVPAFKTTSAIGQFAGLTSLASGAATVVISTSAVKSNAIIMLTPIMRGAIPTAAVLQSSGSLPHSLMVNTVTETTSGGFFTAGWLSGIGYGATMDVAWTITLQA